MRLSHLAPIVLAALPVVARAQPSAQTFRIDPSMSHAAVQVGKSGVLSFAAGHAHEISAPIDAGSVELNPNDLARARIRLTIKAVALSVVAKGEPPNDVPKVQEAMHGPKVLDVARYPTIAFQSTSVSAGSRDGSAVTLTVVGGLTIREVTRPVTVPVHVTLTADALTATGRFTIKQTAFGITPISVAGVVTVKDEVGISFTIAAHR